MSRRSLSRALYSEITWLSYSEAHGFVEKTEWIPRYRLLVTGLATAVDVLSRHWFCEGVLCVDDDLSETHWRNRVWITWQRLAGFAYSGASARYRDLGFLTEEQARERDPEFVEVLMSDEAED